MNKKPFRSLVCLFALLPLLAACLKSAPRQAEEELAPIGSIAVLPVAIEVNADRAIPPEERQRLEEGKEVLDGIIAEYLSGREMIRLVSEAQITAMENDLLFCRTGLARARTVCRKIGSDAALLFTLSRFQERQGNAYSVIKPASVVFDYKLIRTKNGEVLCHGTFDETQKPLFEDILSVFDASKRKRGIKWITARQLAREGVVNKLATCPYLKKQK